jgi:transposase
MKQEIHVRMIKGKKHIVYPQDIKQTIVKEIESGTLSVKEAQLKYGIHRAGTIQDWLKQYSEEYRTKHMRIIYTDAQRRTAVREIESGNLHIKAAAVKYKVAILTIKDWLKVYSCESNISTKSQEIMISKNTVVPVNTDKRKELDELKLKVAGLEAMIDIAEREFNIDIRKKSGTKQ